MGRKCEFCGKQDVPNPEVSFHRFPTDVERRKLWASLLGWSSIKHLKKVFFICSDHFDPQDMAMRTNGAKYLRMDATPLPQHSAFDHLYDQDIDCPENISCSDVSVGKQGERVEDRYISEDYIKCESYSSSSSFSECDNEIDRLEHVETSSRNKTGNMRVAELAQQKKVDIFEGTPKIRINENNPVETSQGSIPGSDNHVQKRRKLDGDLDDPVVSTWCQLLAHKLQDLSKPTRESLMHQIDNLVYQTSNNAVKVEAFVEPSNEEAEPEESHIKLTLDEDSIWTQTIKKECVEIEIEEPDMVNVKIEPT